MTRWKNRKTGKVFALLAHGVDTTHDRGTEVVIYSPEGSPHMICVMDQREFFKDFKNAGPVLPGTENFKQGGK